MIEVRIRSEDNPQGKRLCDWPIDRLDELVRYLKEWGVLTPSLEVASNVWGQFNLDPVPHFDVFVSEDEQ